MNTIHNNNIQNQSYNLSKNEDFLIDSVKILTDLTQRDSERLFNKTKKNSTYLTRGYDWFLRKLID